MPFANCIDGQVIGKPSGNDLYASHLARPGVEDVGHRGHGHRTTLGDTAGLEVGSAKTLPDGVVVHDVLVKVLVGSKDFLWKTSHL